MFTAFDANIVILAICSYRPGIRCLRHLAIPQTGPLQHMETVGASVPVVTPANPNSWSSEASRNPMGTPSTFQAGQPSFRVVDQVPNDGVGSEHTVASLVYCGGLESKLLVASD